MMSLQSSTHSSQMNTVGPAMSFRTSCCDLPQNEQYSVLFESPPLSFVGFEELVAIHRLLDLLERLTGVLSVQRVHPVPDAQDFLGLDLDVRRHALSPARGLVDHDSGIGQRHAHAGLAGGEQEAAH